jgi:hypothetical protein
LTGARFAVPEPPPPAPVDPSEYFPLSDGARWTYAVEGGGSTTIEVQPGTVTINGIATKEVREVAGDDVGSKRFFSNSSGIRLHREFVASESLTGDFLTPLLVASNPFDFGTSSSTGGTVRLTAPGFPALAGTYSLDWQITGRGAMWTPAGFFCDTIKRHESFRISAAGEVVSSSSDQYLVRGLGLVAEQGLDDGELYFGTLTSTSLPLPPVDGDCDGIADTADLCPFHASASIADTDGDGRGNECECGDQSGDGRNTVADLVAINLAIFNPSQVTPLCDGNNDGACDVKDIIAANIEIFSPTNTSTCARQPVPGP